MGTATLSPPRLAQPDLPPHRSRAAAKPASRFAAPAPIPPIESREADPGPPAADGAPTDLRRRTQRDLAERVLIRSEWLMPDERALLAAVYRDGATTVELAALSGMSPKSVRTRVKRLVARVLSPGFEFVMRRRDSWPAERRRVATAFFLQGRSQRDAARFLRLTLHEVRRHIDAVRALASVEGAAERVS